MLSQNQKIKIFKDLKKMKYLQILNLKDFYGDLIYNEVVEFIKELIIKYRNDEKYKKMGEIEFSNDYKKIRKL